MIYQFDGTSLYRTIAVYMILLIVPILIFITILFVGIKVGFKTDGGDRRYLKNFNVVEKCIYVVVPFCITVIIAGVSLTKFVNCINFIYAIESNKLEMAEGKSKICTYTEEWYRDTYLGYSVCLDVGNINLKPVNTFSDEVITVLEKGDNIVVYYGFIGEDILVWSIQHKFEES